MSEQTCLGWSGGCKHSCPPGLVKFEPQEAAAFSFGSPSRSHCQTSVYSLSRMIPGKSFRSAKCTTFCMSLFNCSELSSFSFNSSISAFFLKIDFCSASSSGAISSVWVARVQRVTPPSSSSPKLMCFNILATKGTSSVEYAVVMIYSHSKISSERMMA